MKNLGERETTFRNDFTIADKFGVEAIKDTYNRAFNEWKDNVVYITELVIVLNWKIHEHYDAGKEELARVYNDLREEADNWCTENLKDKELKYFLDKTD